LRQRFSRFRLSPVPGLLVPVLAALLAALLAAACTVAPPREPPGVDPAALWPQRAQQLEALVDWTFSGRAALSGSEVPSRTVRIRWEQANSGFDIAFQSLLGQRVAELAGDPSGVVLRLPGEAPVTADSSRELLTAAIGWSAPVESLRYWVLGLPDPAARDDHELDPWGRLLRLQQDGWLVEYGQYVVVGAIELPRRVTLTHPEVRIRLVIDQWDLGRGNGHG
jgi:outer membrane lipoprotein LolB